MPTAATIHTPYTCQSCGYNYNGEAAHVDGSYRYCGSCYRNYFRPCHQCNTSHHVDRMHNARHGSRRYCRECYNDYRGSHRAFAGVGKVFSPDSSFGSSRYFGVELETNWGKCSNEFAFGAKGDGSISGWEYVSHKLRGDAGLAELKAFMGSGQNIIVENNCGLHLHVDMEGENQLAVFTTYAAYLATQDRWYAKVNSSRQNNRYCYKLTEVHWADMHSALRSYGRFGEFAGYQDRYGWINASAYSRHRTLENRLHHASWNFEEIRTWIVTNLRFVEAAKRLNFLTGETLRSFTERANLALDFAEVENASIIDYEAQVYQRRLATV